MNNEENKSEIGTYIVPEGSNIRESLEPGRISYFEPKQEKIPFPNSKPTIGVIATDVHHGLIFQRGHIFFKELRDKYNFVLLSQDEVGKCSPFYFDLIVSFHPYTTNSNLFVKRVKQQYGIPIITDFDDALDALPVDHPGYVNFKNNKAVDSMFFSDYIVFSTDYLRDRYGHINSKSTVIENCIDQRRYLGLDHNTKPYHAGFIVGWCGGQTHAPDLVNTGFIEGLTMAMRAEEKITANFHVLCNEKLMNEFGARVVFNPDPVDFLDYPSMCFTYPFDLCAVPLYDTPFNDAKSDLRLLDMAPFKIPVLASPRHQFVRHHQTDRLMLTVDDSPQSWKESILRAYQNQSELKMIAETAHHYVMTLRNSHVGAQKWSQLFDQLLSK